MAVSIWRDSITRETAVRIRELLFFQPKPKGKFEIKNPKPPILFCLVRNDEKDENGVPKETLILPFLFAACFFGTHYNHAKRVSYPVATINFTGTLRDRQIPWVNTLYQQLIDKGTSTAGLPPGSGKTIIGAYIASKLNCITCVIYHRTGLGKQWKKSFESNSDAKVWIVGEDKTFPDVINVILCLDQRVKKLPPHILKAVGFLIIDECHMFNTDSHIECLLSFFPLYILAESATFKREDIMHRMMESIVGTHGVFVDLYLKYQVFKINSGIKATRKKNREGDTDWSVLIKSLMYNEERNKILMKILKRYAGVKIIVTTSENQHVIDLEKMIKENVTQSVDSLHDKKKTFRNCDILVGNTPMLGTGFDMENSCPDYDGRPVQMIIIFSSFKKTDLLYQVAGRAFRHESPVVVHVVDDDSIIESHWKIANAWHKKVGATILEADQSSF
jgi:superfamily II DNA or RNA helicase